MKVGVIGYGYIGQAVAEAAAKAGHEVAVYDKNGNCVISSGDSLQTTPEATAWLRIVHSEVFLICVNTPITGPEPVTAAVQKLRTILFPTAYGTNRDERPLVIIESSVPIGYTRSLAAETDSWCEMAHSPERLWPDHEGEWPIEDIPRLVGGVTPEATELACDFYRTFVKTVIPCSSPEVTEMAKLYENTQRTVNIAYANCGKEIAERFGIDFREVLEGCKTKPFGYVPYVPGIAGGTCLPANMQYLRQACEKDTLAESFLEEARWTAKQIPVAEMWTPVRGDGTESNV